jgi:hypothetical protein
VGVFSSFFQLFQFFWCESTGFRGCSGGSRRRRHPHACAPTGHISKHNSQAGCALQAVAAPAAPRKSLVAQEFGTAGRRTGVLCGVPVAVSCDVTYVWRTYVCVQYPLLRVLLWRLAPFL